jgi:ubiquinone/menaquinone biosynthesis C-methylase UbiE
MTLLHDAALTAAFDRGADSYDRLVALNPGYHAHLRRSARRLALPDGGAGRRVLDLGCGTGASTAALAAAFPHAEIVGADASAAMLARARRRRGLERVRLVHATAEDLVGGAAHGPFDAVFAAYLFRNVTDPDAVLRGVHDLLVAGGRLVAHEYALGGRRADRSVWSAVCRGVVVPLGTVTGDRALYRHLWRSVLEFDTAPEFAARMRRAGFDAVRVLPLPGWQTGVAHTFAGRRHPVTAADGGEGSPASPAAVTAASAGL